jgi:hypothetical protein
MHCSISSPYFVSPQFFVYTKHAPSLCIGEKGKLQNVPYYFYFKLMKFNLQYWFTDLLIVVEVSLCTCPAQEV